MSENSGHIDNDSFKKASETISLLYAGTDEDVLFSAATEYFDELLEIYSDTDEVRQKAAGLNYEVRHLVEGAGLLISKMHFNPENNFYITLGVPRTVSSDELNRRWKKLMLLYHPDRLGANSSIVSEYAKKVNEAYNVLKDSTKRAEYDRRLTAGMLAKMFPSPDSNRYINAGIFKSAYKAKSSHRDGATAYYFSKIPAGIYLITALLIPVFIYIQSRADRSNTGEINSGINSAPPSSIKSDLSERLQKDDIHIANSAVSDIKSSSAADRLKMTIPEQSHSEDTVKGKDMNKASQLPDSHDVNITREEAEAITGKYVRAYSAGDLDLFMSLFSKRAVENSSLNFNEIQNTYKEVFSDRINYMKLMSSDIKTEGRSATISGVYSLNQYNSAENRWVQTKGSVTFKLEKEDRMLKIVSVTYDK